jgi:hypothetical protein
MGPGIAGLATLVPNIVSGIVSKVAHNKYAKLLDGIKMDMPSQYDEARGIYQKLAATGLPGVDQAKLDLMGNVPTTLNAYKEVADNPASILGALSDAQTGVNKGLTDLSIKDAVAKISNMQGLGEYMQREGLMENNIEKYNNEIKMSAGAERMAGTAELLKGITGGVGGGISAFGNMQMANDLSAYYNPIKTGAAATPGGVTPDAGAADLMNVDFNKLLDPGVLSSFSRKQRNNLMDKMLKSF